MGDNYSPDGCAIIKINSNGETYFKVFSSWSGSYLYGSSWRLNSGIKKVIVHPEHYEFEGYSGSVVRINRGMGRISAHNMSVLSEVVNQDGVTLLDNRTFLAELERFNVEVVYIDEEG